MGVSLYGAIMNGYLVWYRLKYHKQDRICGYARNWQRAEEMAAHLKMILESRGKKPKCVGVKRASHGSLYDDEEWSLRWTVFPPESENNS